MRIGMGCKAQTTDIAVAMARICNAADRPRPRLHTREEIVNTFLAAPHRLALATPDARAARQTISAFFSGLGVGLPIMRGYA